MLHAKETISDLPLTDDNKEIAKAQEIKHRVKAEKEVRDHFNSVGEITLPHQTVIDLTRQPLTLKNQGKVVFDNKQLLEGSLAKEEAVEQILSYLKSMGSELALELAPVMNQTLLNNLLDLMCVSAQHKLKRWGSTPA